MKGITPYKPTSVEIKGVRYIVDEEADMRVLRNHEARQRKRAEREFKCAVVFLAAEMGFRETGEPVNAQDVLDVITGKATLADRDPDGPNLVDRVLKAWPRETPRAPHAISVADVRYAMAQPKGLEWFKRVRPKPRQRVCWEPTAVFQDRRFCVSAGEGFPLN